MTASRYVTIWCDERDWSSLDNPGCGKFIGEGEHMVALSAQVEEVLRKTRPVRLSHAR
mgnify:CR=1 FL=1